MVLSLAGNSDPSGTTSGDTDGTGTMASFAGPYGMTVDTAGNLFVADYTGNTVRKVSSTNGEWIDRPHKCFTFLMWPRYDGNCCCCDAVSCTEGLYFNDYFCTWTPKGYYSPASKPTILYGCPAGSYSTEMGQTSCQTSPFGNFTPTAGQSEYFPCPNNTYYSIDGASECKEFSSYPTSFPTLAPKSNKNTSKPFYKMN
jgi:hypothetical protein